MKKKQQKKIRSITYRLFSLHLEDGEEIVMVAHRHPFILIKKGWKILLLGYVIPLFLWYIFPEIWFLNLAWLLAGTFHLYKLIFNYYYDAILVTKKSLIDVKWDGPFTRTAVRLDYAMIEGTTTATPGFFHTIFNFGTLQVNRQGGTVGIELLDAINPAKVEAVILSMQEQYLNQKNFNEIKNLKNLLSSMVSKHMNEVELEF